MLTVSGVTKWFGDAKAVSDLSFDVQAGEVFCILGANGAGKTTTMNMLLGFFPPDRGSARFGALDLWHDRVKCRDHIVYVPENVNLYPMFSAVENIEYLAALARLPVSEGSIIQALLDAGLHSESHHRAVESYSKGMRQKVAIAFALLKEARLVLLDEPTSGLDPTATRDFISAVNHLREGGAAVLIITHDLQCAHLLANRIGIIHRGELKRLLDNNLSLDALEAAYFAVA